ncbi:hypothetical protein T4E_2669 [Trichinella pseudospiralis]|uniref:Uncharacterized protein n=1 Tax=Trichinella pseudospiralis TaxID=6337 RepID=A0A0V0YB08_TRIPS|nr:hypothetical protein T4E_2669 [Trichinella pseudospiralis]
MLKVSSVDVIETGRAGNETSVPRLDDWSEMKPFGVVELVERSIAKSTKETTGCSDRRMSVIDCCPQSPAVSTGKA